MVPGRIFLMDSAEYYSTGGVRSPYCSGSHFVDENTQTEVFSGNKKNPF